MLREVRLQEKLGVTDNGGQGVVQFRSETACEMADRRKPIGVVLSPLEFEHPLDFPLPLVGMRGRRPIGRKKIGWLHDGHTFLSFTMSLASGCIGLLSAS